MSTETVRPIIIKRKKVIVDGGHHGGAWKVAYADFVTAMMAFFMLMWLLNATTEQQRKGLADYFAPTIAIARVSGGGDGAFGGESINAESSLPQLGEGGLIELELSEVSPDGALGTDETAEFEELANGILGKGGDSLVHEMMSEHVTAKVTDEGLIIEIFDIEGDPLFDPKTGNPTRILEEIALILVEEFAAAPNRMAITSHSRTYARVVVENPAWKVTTERAHMVRELMQRIGIDPARFERITGYGQSKPFLPDTMAARNNRIEVILLRDLDQ